MFFRRQSPPVASFDQKLQSLKQTGFTVQSQGPGKARVSRLGYAAVVEDAGQNPARIGKAGVLLGDEIGVLANGGYQMFLVTPSGRREPALAPQLKALHSFDEDLKEALGLTSLYNESLGTTSELHIYDRVEDRDEGVAPRPWEK